MTKSLSGILLILSSGLILSAAASLTGPDLDFVNTAAKGGNAEVELGKLAAQKATNPEVKRFADRMVRDHENINAQLTALASSKGVTLPDGKGMMSDATYMELKVLSGKEFDQAYVKAMVSDHQEDVSAFKKQSMDAQDPAVKSFAAKTLPTIEQHLTMVQKLQSDIAGQ